MNKPPAPVVVANPDPISVEVHEAPKQTEIKKVETTARIDAEVLRTEDQRRISGIWERTQQIIALSVVEVTLIVIAIIVSTPGVATVLGVPIPQEAQSAAQTGLVFLASIANLVIGFYFGRTNHSRSGGVGPEDVSRS